MSRGRLTYTTSWDTIEAVGEGTSKWGTWAVLFAAVLET